MIATVVLTLLAIGTSVYFARGRVWFDFEERKRVATLIAQDSMERTLAQEYVKILSWNEVRTVSGVSYTVEVAVQDKVPAASMKTIKSKVMWNQTKTATRTVSLATLVYEKK